LWEHHIDNGGVVVGGFHEGEARLAIGCVVDGVARLLQAAHDEGGDFGIIFDDEDTHGARFEGGIARVEAEGKRGRRLERKRRGQFVVGQVSDLTVARWATKSQVEDLTYCGGDDEKVRSET
jgi:hypothetical protein